MPATVSSSIPRDLLAWYDAHARDLPWRAPPGTAAPDPYRVWLSEVMLQQTGVATVKPYFEDFLARWPAVKALAAAPREDVLKAWAGLGYYARARNLKACAEAVARDHNGVFPDTVEGLRALPGIGEYTAAAIAAIAFDVPAAVVDANIERVIARLHAMQKPARGEIEGHVSAMMHDHLPGDVVQALMDLGASICRPRQPLCHACPLRGDCAAAATCCGVHGPICPTAVRVRMAAATSPRSANPTRKPKTRCSGCPP